MNHLGRLVTAVFAASTAIACGQQSPSTSGASDRSVAWVLQIASQADFGVRVWLDGEAIYSQATLLAQSHRVEVERPYGTGAHVVEFEVLAAKVSPATYTPTWTVHVTPAGSLFTADGAPTVLTIGERLTVLVSL